MLEKKYENLNVDLQIQTENLFKEIFNSREKVRNNMIFIQNNPEMSKSSNRRKRKTWENRTWKQRRTELTETLEN